MLAAIFYVISCIFAGALGYSLGKKNKTKAFISFCGLVIAYSVFIYFLFV